MDFYVDIDRDPLFRKEFGAHFTPSNIVEEMCSSSISLLGNIDKEIKILDLASGTGIFTYFIAQKISDILETSFKVVVEVNCLMAELDQVFINKCKEIFLLHGAKPTILKGDALFNEELNFEKFDIIVSNPPYVRIQNLDDDYMEKLKSNYLTCNNGASDIYLAFFELAMRLIKPNGVISFITPSSFLRSEAASKLRNIMAPSLLTIKDFGSNKQFDCGTYSAITYLKANTSTDFVYKLDNVELPITKTIFKDKLLIASEGNTTLKDVCKIRGGIATLRDKIFIVTPDRVDEEFIYYNDNKLEIGSIRKFVKLSLVKTAEDIYDSELVCIYPYKTINDSYGRYSEAEFKTLYPNTYSYLYNNKEELLKRDKGKNKTYEWFEFGRTQGLTPVSKCLVTSTMNKTPNFFEADLTGYLFSAGLVIQDIKTPVELFLNIVNSDNMEKYIYFNGSKYSGGWRGYNKKILEKFKFDLTNII